MTKTLRPGVQTGEDYLTLLAACKDGGYALPAVNIVGTNSINAVGSYDQQYVRHLVIVSGNLTDAESIGRVVVAVKNRVPITVSQTRR